MILHVVSGAKNGEGSGLQPLGSRIRDQRWPRAWNPAGGGVVTGRAHGWEVGAGAGRDRSRELDEVQRGAEELWPCT
jgi:hypothetical protein